MHVARCQLIARLAPIRWLLSLEDPFQKISQKCLLFSFSENCPCNFLSSVFLSILLSRAFLARELLMWWETYGPFRSGTFCAYPEAGEVIAHYRERRGLMRVQLAAGLDMTENMIYRMERYSYALNSVPLLCRIQSLLDIPPAL